MAWQVLQAIGGFLVGHYLRHTSQVYGVFAIVLGLLFWLYLGAQLTLYAAEVNVVAARRLWPRSRLRPPSTNTDQPAPVDLANQQQTPTLRRLPGSRHRRPAHPRGGRSDAVAGCRPQRDIGQQPWSLADCRSSGPGRRLRNGCAVRRLVLGSAAG